MENFRLLPVASLAILISLFVLSSCGDPDPEETVEPTVDLRDQFIGTYSFREECPDWDDSYSVTISKDGNALEVFNLYGAGKRSRAYVNNSGELNIHTTEVGRTDNGCTIELRDASGFIQGSKLSIVFEIGSSARSWVTCDHFSFTCSGSGRK